MIKGLFAPVNFDESLKKQVQDPFHGHGQLAIAITNTKIMLFAFVSYLIEFFSRHSGFTTVRLKKKKEVKFLLMGNAESNHYQTHIQNPR